MNKFLWRSAFYASAMLLLGGSANAAITRVAGPTTINFDGRQFVTMDSAYDSINRVFLVVYGTNTPVVSNGIFVNESGVPVSAPLVLSDGSLQAGWTRVTYSAAAGKFLVTYVKILGASPAHHQRYARFLSYGAGLGPEILIDDWLGDSGSASGLTYSTMSGKFLLTWSHYYGSFPVTFVATITTAGVPSCGPTTATATSAAVPCTVITYPGDGETNSEIDCDPTNRKCLVVGTAWGVLDGTGKSAYWYRFIDDSTGSPLGAPAYFVNVGGALQDPPAVAYMAPTSGTSGHFLVAVTYAGTILGFTADGAAGLVTALTPATPLSSFIMRDTTGTQGSGYGFPALRFNPASQTAYMSLSTWIGYGAVQEFDGSNSRVTGGFDLIPEPRIVAGNANSANDYTNVAPNTIAGGLLAFENVFFEYLRVSVYTGGVSAPAPPPPPPCTATPATTSMTVPFTVATQTLGVTTDTSTCAWTATSGAPWITIVGGASNVGAATVTFVTGFNSTGAGRTGTITVGGKVVSIVQPGVNLAAISDMTGDGLSDLLTRNTATGEIRPMAVGLLAAWTLPSLVFADGSPVPFVPLDYQVVGTGDLNGDGYADIVWQQQSTGNLYAWLMQGTIVVATPALSIPTVGTTGWQVRAIADLNGDGRADLVFQNSANGALAVWLMNGATVVGTAWITDGAGTPLIMPDPNWQIVGAGDLDRDGKADLIWRNQVTGGVGAWAMNGNAVRTMRSLSPDHVSSDYVIGGVGDVNGDYIADIIWIKPSTGELFVWCMSGFSANVYAGILMLPGGAPAVLPVNWTLVGPG